MILYIFLFILHQDRGRSMNRTNLNYVVDVILTVLFLAVAITGFVMLLALPSGVPQGRYQEFIGITKATWAQMHNVSSILMTVLMVVHIALHKRWIYCTTRNIFKKEDKNCEID